MIRILLVFITLTSLAIGMTYDTPTHGDLWKSAQVVVSSENYQIKGNENQEDLPKHWRYKYTRVTVIFEVSEVLKGSNQDIDNELFIETYIREEKADAKRPEDVLFTTPPHKAFADTSLENFQDLLPDKTYYIFLRWDALGHLVPIDEEHFSVVASIK